MVCRVHVGGSTYQNTNEPNLLAFCEELLMICTLVLQKFSLVKVKAEISRTLPLLLNEDILQTLSGPSATSP